MWLLWYEQRALCCCEGLATVVSMARLDVEVAYETNFGNRKHMEDVAIAMCDSGGAIAGVFDGLGGHARGDDASAAACEAIHGPIGTESEMCEVLFDANRRVWDLIAEDEHLTGMNAPGIHEPQTTGAIISWTDKGGVQAGWVGDSIVFAIPLRDRSRGWHGPPQGRWGHHILDWSLGGSADLPSRWTWTMSARDKGWVDAEIRSYGMILGAATDGLFEPLMKAQYGRSGIVGGLGQEPDDNSLGFAVPMDIRHSATEVAAQLMHGAAAYGFEDNAAVSIIRIAAS